MISRDLNNIEILNIIGKGTFGNVYLGKDKTTKEYFAVKIISKKLLKNSQSLEYFNNEISILKKINHPNIIKFKGLFENEDYYYLLSEYCNGGTLYNAMRFYHKNYSKPIKENIAKYFIFNILKGIIHLNENNIIHRDIKSDNILLHYDNYKDLITNNFLNAKIKIIDFGFAKFLNKNELAGSLVGTPMYMDPIILNSLIISNKKKLKGFYDNKVDVWSLGILTYELLIGVLPFIAKNLKELFLCIQNRDFVIPKEDKRNFQLSKEALFFIDKCLNIDINLRPSPIELIKDEWIIKNFDEKENEKNLNIYEMKSDEEIIDQKQDSKFFSYWKIYLGKTDLKKNNTSCINPNKKKINGNFYQTERATLTKINKIINITRCSFKSKMKLGSNMSISNSDGLIELNRKKRKTNGYKKSLTNLKIDLKNCNNKIIIRKKNKLDFKKKFDNIVNSKKNFKTLQIEKKDKTKKNIFDFIRTEPNLSTNLFNFKKIKNCIKNNSLKSLTQVNREKILNNNKYNPLFKKKSNSLLFEFKNLQKSDKNLKKNKKIIQIENFTLIDPYHNMINKTEYERNNNNFICKNLNKYTKHTRKKDNINNNNKNKNNKNNDFYNNNKTNNFQKLTQKHIFNMKHKIVKSCEVGFSTKTNNNKI